MSVVISSALVYFVRLGVLEHFDRFMVPKHELKCNLLLKCRCCESPSLLVF